MNSEDSVKVKEEPKDNVSRVLDVLLVFVLLIGFVFFVGLVFQKENDRAIDQEFRIKITPFFEENNCVIEDLSYHETVDGIRNYYIQVKNTGKPKLSSEWCMRTNGDAYFDPVTKEYLVDLIRPGVCRNITKEEIAWCKTNADTGITWTVNDEVKQ
jgi:hypothetical protein